MSQLALEVSHGGQRGQRPDDGSNRRCSNLGLTLHCCCFSSWIGVESGCDAGDGVPWAFEATAWHGLSEERQTDAGNATNVDRW